MAKQLLARTIIALSLCCATHLAWALDLDQARAGGLVGERADGLIGPVVANPAAEVKQLVYSVNAQRLETYRSLAAKNGTPIDAVQKLAGEKQVSKARENGWYWMDAASSWHKG